MFNKQYDGDPNTLSALGLAYIGDCIYELLVREYIISKGNVPVRKLHTETVAIVCANGQSDAVEIILPLLDETELSMYKRGRNANGNNVPKNANIQVYRRATGFETLMGYLYLSNKYERIQFLFDTIITAIKFN